MLSVKPWRAEAVIFFAAVQMVCTVSGALAVAVLNKLDVVGFRSMDSLGSLVVGSSTLQGATCVLMPLFFRYHNVSLKDGLGFDKKWVRALLLAFGVMIIILPVAGLLHEESVALMKKIGWKIEDETAVTMVANASSRLKFIYLGFWAVILAPIGEEFVFRGVLFPFIKQLGFPKLAWIGVSLLFALIHANAPVFIPLFVLALAFTWLYETTDCLLAPIFAHMLFNVAGLIQIGQTSS